MLYRQIIAKTPHEVAALHALGTLCLQAQRVAEARDLFARATEADARHADAWANLGQCERALGNAEAARAACEQAIALNPRQAIARYELAQMCAKANESDVAIDHYRQLLREKPDHVAATVNLSVLLRDRKELAECEALLQRADALMPNHFGILNNLGLLRQMQYRVTDAIEIFCRVVALKPDYAEAWNNLGAVLQDDGQGEAALRAFSRAIELRPDDLSARFNRMLCNLTFGNFPEAWAEWEVRLRYKPSRGFTQKLWDGSALRGKRMAIWSDQGIGDDILVATMIPDLLARGAELIVEVPPRLVPLYRRAFPDVVIVERPLVDPAQDKIATPPDPRIADPSIDWQAPDMWAAIFLRRSFADFPRQTALLKAEAAQTSHLREKYSAMGKKRIIGISWGSGAKKTGFYKTSVLRDWLPILQTPDVLFVDLQYGDTATERAAVLAEYPDIALYHDPDIDQMRDLDAFAAQVAVCDQVVSISNTAVHFAGALGVPAILMLPQGVGSLWYWFREREKSPWYPSLTIVRQKTAGSWTDVIAEVAFKVRESFARASHPLR